MQVRKFEAKTIKDAIELVKFHMGPDAIILSAKDNSKRFGLMGEPSVEVTAAVSETKLFKKQMAEKKLDSRTKQKYQQARASIQKEYIDRVFQENQGTPMMVGDHPAPGAEPVVSAPARRKEITKARYIDIGEEGEISAEPVTPIRPEPVPVARVVTTDTADQDRIASLQNEIFYLRQMLERFQKVPQNFLALHPGAEDGLPYDLSFVFKKLQDVGVRHEYIVEILKIANEVLPTEQKKKKAFVDGWVIKYLLEHIQIVEKPLKSKYHVFLGPTGQGKTSTVVKLACHLLLKEKKRVAILSGDHVKVGAKDQLKIYAQILNVPCGTITKSQDWVAVEKALEGMDYVLFDTPGVNLRHPEEVEALQKILPPKLSEMNTHFVQSIMARDEDAFEVAQRFKAFGFQDVIFTRLDEAVRHGLIYNFHKKFNAPLYAFGIGSDIPEDFEFASKERVVDLLFQLSKIKNERGQV